MRDSEHLRVYLLEGLREAGYYPRSEDILFLSVLLQGRRLDGLRAGLISGPPGVGKTALGRALARVLMAKEIYFLCHHWVTDEDLFVRIDPALVAAMAGGVLKDAKPDQAWGPGALLRATLASRKGYVVLIIDEIDKAPQRVDALLLDFIQSGRVHGPFGEVWEADPDRLILVLTENGTRPLAEPLLRRVFRYRMDFLPPDQEADLIRKKTGVPAPVAKAIVAAAFKIRMGGASSPSLQEEVGLAGSLHLAKSVDDVELLLKGFLIKYPEDEEALKDYGGARGVATTIWGEWIRKGGR